jgi:Na+/H+-dicarboxylate symporter
MKTIATFNAIICALVFARAVYLGLDPKKWQTWLIGLYCFLSLFFAGIVGTGNSFESGKVGAIITFALVFGGIITYWSRERAKKWLIDHHKEE